MLFAAARVLNDVDHVVFLDLQLSALGQPDGLQPAAQMGSIAGDQREVQHHILYAHRYSSNIKRMLQGEVYRDEEHVRPK